MLITKKSNYSYLLPAIPPALWGTGIGIAKFLLSSFPIDSITLVYSRFLFTALLMLPLMFYLVLKPNKNSTLAETTGSFNLFLKNKTILGISFIIAISLTGVALNNYVFYYGLTYTLASDSALIVGLSPIISIILASIIIKKPFQRNQLIGSILGLFGVGLIIGLQIFNLNISRLLGDIIVLVGITLWSSSFIFSKKASEIGYSAIAITFYSIAIAVIFMTPLILLEGYLSTLVIVLADFRFLLAMLFFGLLSGALGYSIWYGTIHKLGPVETAIFLVSIPFWTLIFSFLFLHESITIFHITGLVFISIGVVIVNKKDLLKKSSKSIFLDTEEATIN